MLALEDLLLLEWAAPHNGDMKTLGAMLAADISLHADGGGKRPAAMKPILGFNAVMKIHEPLVAHFWKNGSKLESMSCGTRTS